MIIATLIERCGDVFRELVVIFDDKIEHVVAYWAGAETLWHGHHVMQEKLIKRRRKQRKEAIMAKRAERPINSAEDRPHV